MAVADNVEYAVDYPCIITSNLQTFKLILHIFFQKKVKFTNFKKINIISIVLYTSCYFITILLLQWYTCFWSPAGGGNGTYEFASVRPFVRSFVRSSVRPFVRSN